MNATRPRHRLENAAASALSGVVRGLPRGWVLALGRALGRTVAAFDRRHVDIAVDGLRRAFPDWSDADARRSARRVYAHVGQQLVDTLWLQRRTWREIEPLCEVVGGEHLVAAREAGTGIVFATAHFGAWEMNGVAHGWSQRPLDVVARPLDNPLLDARLTGVRQMSGNTVVDKRRALGRLLRTLRAGGDVALLVDQNTLEKDGIFIEFFGRPACATTAVAALHVKTGCPIVAGCAEVLPGGRYRLRYEPPIFATPTTNRRARIAKLTQRVNTIIEDWVRERPEQWLWIHRRWKTQPAPGAGLDPALSEADE